MALPTSSPMITLKSRSNIEKDKEIMNKDIIPGPGTYNPSDEKIITSSPRTK